MLAFYLPTGALAAAFVLLLSNCCAAQSADQGKTIIDVTFSTTRVRFRPTYNANIDTDQRVQLVLSGQNRLDVHLTQETGRLTRNESWNGGKNWFRLAHLGEEQTAERSQLAAKHAHNDRRDQRTLLPRFSIREPKARLYRIQNADALAS